MRIEDRLLSRAGAAAARGLRVRTAYSDMDGTLLGRGGAFVRDHEGEPTGEPMAALMEATAAGIEIVPASGRALRGLVGDGRLLGQPTVIAEMGALVSYDYGREVVRNFGETPVDGDEWPAATMVRTGALGFLFEAYEGALEFHTPWSAWRECSQLLRGRLDPAEAEERLRDAGHGWVTVVDNGRLHGAYAGLAPGEAHVYHLMPRGVSKGTGVALDRARRGIAREECIAVGDALADLSMAGEVGALVLVRDAVEASDELAERALALDNVWISDRPMNLGWVDAIRALALE